MKDAMGDRMKNYEAVEASRKAMPYLPICVRLDGKTFSSYTRGLAKPWDEGLRQALVDTTIYLVEMTNARVGYTQSDEISLILYTEEINETAFFGGKFQKITSVLASACTAKFNSLVPELVPSKAGKMAMFDCRVWNVPNKDEAANVILWREFDATRNSIQSAAQNVYSHKQLDRKNSGELQEMLFQKGINWNDYPDSFKRGTYIQRRKRLRKFTEEELERIPKNRRPDKDAEIERTDIIEITMPRLASVVNRVDTLFDGADPEVSDE